MRLVLHVLLRSVLLVVDLVRALRPDRTALIAENLALRQQLAALHRLAQKDGRRVPLEPFDRMFWSLLARTWDRWRDALCVVSPKTVIGWHRTAWRAWWTHVSRRPPGRPPIPTATLELIEELARDNPTWGSRRIASELHHIGVRVDHATVCKHMKTIRPVDPATGRRKGPDQSWRVFLKNHLEGTLAIDFFTVATATLDVVYGFVVLSLDRRKILHVHTADRPGALWALRQVRYAVELAGERVRCLLRDNDGIYGDAFSEGVRADGLNDHRISPRSPWQNGHVERVIGTLRRELLDHVIVLNSWHLLRLLDEFKKYYNRDRPDAALDQVPPEPREVHPPAMGKVVALPRLGGLHHRYERRKAA